MFDQLGKLGCKVVRRFYERGGRMIGYITKLKSVYNMLYHLESWDQIIRLAVGELKVESRFNSS
ncbi:MAG: hypothetical protein H6625_00500 [Bdellovibrionaceae bacterium]|nr:hypothetical protein [Pseudobdellovibrionaceae bacterium]